MTRVAAALLGVLSLGAAPPADEFRAIFDRTVAYVAGFEKEFAAIIWHESYDQLDRLPKTFHSSGTSFTGNRQRHLESEMLFISEENFGSWVTVRDVISVDGKPVRRRLPALLANKNVRMPDLRALALENGRYNIGVILRNFNEPTLTLVFLDDRYRSRFRFSDRGPTDLAGARLRKIAFTEVVTPTIVQSDRGDVHASGTILVDPPTGQIVRTEMILAHGRNDTRAEITVSYGRNEKLGLLVPTEMREAYGWERSQPDQRIVCTAKYTDFRRFETSGRIISR